MNCYILTGGRSTRMGRSKRELFFDRVAAAARGAFDAVIEDAHDDGAPIFGVRRALQSEEGKCFVLAVDYPRITSPMLADLRARFERSSRPMLVPVWRGIPQVLCAGYDAAMLSRVEERIAARQYSLQPLADAAERIDVEGDAWASVNTPEELDDKGLLPSR
jgi:molybdopterin-guanine dinucleotide biosynthesis protein A